MPENHCYAVSCYSDTHCETTPATEETFNVKLVKVRRVVIPTPDDNNNVNNRNMVNSNYNAEEEFIRSKVVTAAENGISNNNNNNNNNNSRNNNNNNRLSSSMTATTKSTNVSSESQGNGKKILSYSVFNALVLLYFTCLTLSTKVG